MRDETPVLQYDKAGKFFYYPGVTWLNVPVTLFMEAVEVYQFEHRSSRTAAVQKARMLQYWERDGNGRIFFWV